jgi:hypothetical protein
MCKMKAVAGRSFAGKRHYNPMKTILLLAAAVMSLALNSCAYFGETDPFYADGHRRSPFYGRFHTYTTKSITSKSIDTIHYTYPSSGRSGVR